MIVLQAEMDQELVDIIGRIRAFQQDFPLSLLFPTAAQAVKGATAAVQSQWKAYAGGKPLPSGDRIKRPTGGYAASINTTPESLWSYRVASKAAVARWLENGTPELDMKQTHPYGPRGRVAKKKMKGGGIRYVPYVIVPFRWATPKSGAHMGVNNVIPDQVYAAIRSGVRKGTFKKSVVLDGKTNASNFWGDSEARATYAWGDRVKGVGGNIEGLVAMDGTYGDKGDGLKKVRPTSTYFTFRVISADSPPDRWIKPATKPLKIAEQTASFMSDKVSKMVEAGFYADLKGSLN